MTEQAELPVQPIENSVEESYEKTVAKRKAKLEAANQRQISFPAVAPKLGREEMGETEDTSSDTQTQQAMVSRPIESDVQKALDRLEKKDRSPHKPVVTSRP